MTLCITRTTSLHKMSQVLRCHRNKLLRVEIRILLVFALDDAHVPPVPSNGPLRRANYLYGGSVQTGTRRKVANLHQISRVDQVGHAVKRGRYHGGFLPLFRIGGPKAVSQQAPECQTSRGWLVLAMVNIHFGIAATFFSLSKRCH